MATDTVTANSRNSRPMMPPSAESNHRKETVRRDDIQQNRDDQRGGRNQQAWSRCRSSLAHIIGVSVNETNAEMRIVTSNYHTGFRLDDPVGTDGRVASQQGYGNKMIMNTAFLVERDREGVRPEG